MASAEEFSRHFPKAQEVYEKEAMFIHRSASESQGKLQLIPADWLLTKRPKISVDTGDRKPCYGNFPKCRNPLTNRNKSQRTSMWSAIFVGLSVRRDWSFYVEETAAPPSLWLCRRARGTMCGSSFLTVVR